MASNFAFSIMGYLVLVSEWSCYKELKTEKKNSKICLSTQKTEPFEIWILLLKITLEGLGWE